MLDLGWLVEKILQTAMLVYQSVFLLVFFLHIVVQIFVASPVEEMRQTCAGLGASFYSPRD